MKILWIHENFNSLICLIQFRSEIILIHLLKYITIQRKLFQCIFVEYIQWPIHYIVISWIYLLNVFNFGRKSFKYIFYKIYKNAMEMISINTCWTYYSNCYFSTIIYLELTQCWQCRQFHRETVEWYILPIISM